MGNYFVTLVNETPYTFSYSRSYLGSDWDIRDQAVIAPWQTVVSQQRELISLLYVRFGQHDGGNCRQAPDLSRQYTGIDNPTFYIRMINWDRSEIQLVCNRGGPDPICPNYVKQEEDRITQQREQTEREEAERRQREEAERQQREEEEHRQREEEEHHRREEEERRQREEEERRQREEEERRQREEEERRQREEEERRQREEAERQQREEERRQQERLEREKRIAEEIERESKSLEEQLSKTSEKLKRKSHQRGRENLQERSNVTRYTVEDDATGIETQEEKDIEDQFNQLLFNINVKEDESIASKDLGVRLKALQQHLIAQYFMEKDIPIWCHGSLDKAFDHENLSLTEQMSLLKTTVQVTLYSAGTEMVNMLTYKEEIDDKASCLIRILDILYKTNQTLAGKLSRVVFSTLSTTNQDHLGHILFSRIWTPIQAIVFTLKVQETSLEQNKMERVLQCVQTYQVDINTTISSLKEQDPLQHLQQHVKKEKDKDLKTILAEMRANKYPEKVLLILEQVLTEVGIRLPAYKTLDLDEKMKKEGIDLTRSIDFENPEIETLVKVFIGLAVAVQDTTTIIKESGQKIEGYFPRMTQLASVLTLLVSKASECNGCLLEIFTGEGKSSIVAMLALIHAIRGKKIEVITSSPVLARRDQEEWTKLFKMFDISCSVVPPPGLDGCNDSRQREKAIKEAYRADIVYGTIGNFAADILRQEFEKCNTRGDRAFDLAIVDEVDYMTLDSGVQVTFLSHAATGIRHLEQLLAAIWTKVCTCQRIQDSQTGDILWVAGTQYFHKVAATAVMGPNTSEHFSPFDILMPGLQLGFFTEQDVKQLESFINQSEQPSSEEPRDSEIKELMDKLGPAQQKDLLSIFQKVLEDVIEFEYYEVKDGKAAACDIISTSGRDKVCILLQDHGCACEVMSDKALIEGTIAHLESRIRYSDAYQPPEEQNTDDEPFILLPAYLKEYTKSRMKVFVENALKAIIMVKDREYMIESATDQGQIKADTPIHEYHCIIPVDFKATGVLEKNKRWGDGLQQFLEMKHQLAISPLSNVTNFMSNYHFLQRYTKGTGLFGVSGTLGDEAEVAFLKKHYKVSCYLMPTHRYTKKTELPAIQVEEGKDVWIEKICECVKECTSLNQCVKGQAILVVCEDVKTTENLQKKLMELEAVPNLDKITLYTRSDQHNIENRVFDSGDVVIATNLGGRGTDVKISQDVNESGGLFVILTHFPTNMRVEKQIFGRTSRKGNPGMVQMILNYQDLAPAYQGQPIEVMRQLRADYEKKRIAEMENDELLEVRMREELFLKFCELMNHFQGHYEKVEKRDIYMASNVLMNADTFDYSKTKLDYRPALNALKETWALWLTLHDQDIENHKDPNQLKQELSNVIQKRAESLLKGESDNFYDFIKQAMDRMYLHTQNKGSDYGALSFWEKAERTDRVYRAVSLYNRAYITINLGQGNYIQTAIDLLKESKKRIDVYVSEVSNTTVACQMACIANFEPHNRDEPNFSKQMQTRKSLYKSWIDYIDKSVAKLTELQNQKSNAMTKDKAVFSLSSDHSLITSDELTVLYDYGLSFVFEVEKKPEFCIDALICFIIGALQVLAGILVCVLTLGTASQIGMGLISEGVSDMISGIEGMIKGTFSWAEWAISKAISIGLSLVTAGFSTIKKVAETLVKVTKSLLTGVKTFASVADDIIKSGKALISTISTSVKSMATSVTKQSLTQSIKVLATNSAVKKTFIQAAKYAGQEIAKQGVLKGLEYGMDKGLQAVFKAIFEQAFKDLIAQSIKGDQALNLSLTKFAIVRGVPEKALLTENPDTFQIRAAHREIMNNIMVDVCHSAVEDVTDDYNTASKFFTHLQAMEEGVVQILEKAKVKGAIQKAFKLSAEIGKSSVEFVQMINSAPTQEVIEKRVIPFMVNRCDELTPVTEYKEDGRRQFPDVEKLKMELLNSVSQRLNEEFVALFASRLTSLINNPIRREMNKHVGEKLNNILGRNKTERFFIEQKHKRKMKKTQLEGAKRPLTEAEQKEFNQYLKKMEAASCPATELDLNILTKSDLLEGKGIKVIVLDEKRRNIGTEIYPGKDSAAGIITLQLNKIKAKEDGGANWTDRLLNRVKGKENLYSGQFSLVTPDGSTAPDNSESTNSLYRALIMARGSQADIDVNKEAAALRSKVHKEVSENQDRYGGLVKRQLDFEKLYTMAGKYTIESAVQSGVVPSWGMDEDIGSGIMAPDKTKHCLNRMSLAEQDLVFMHLLGKADEHSRLSTSFVRGDNDQLLVEAQHIPSKGAIMQAVERMPGSEDPLIARARKDPTGGTLLAVNVLSDHCWATLANNFSKPAEKTRALIAQEILSGNWETVLRLAMIVAHPLGSENLRQDAALESTSLKYSSQGPMSDEGTKAYYQMGFYRLVRQYWELTALNDVQYGLLLAWIEQESYLQKDTPEYQQILQCLQIKGD